MPRTSRTSKKATSHPPAVWSTPASSAQVGAPPSPEIAAIENAHVMLELKRDNYVRDRLAQNPQLAEEHAEQLGLELVDPHDIELRVEKAKEELFDEIKSEFETDLRKSVTRQIVNRCIDELQDSALDAESMKVAISAIENYVGVGS